MATTTTGARVVGRVVAGALAAVTALALVPARAVAQSNDEIQTATQFNFSTPGARSLGLGGAFLAAADDATAAYTNPAGLTQLASPEVSVEVRRWRFSSRFAEGGHLPATGVTGIGIDTLGGLREGDREDRTAGVSFLSYVYTGDRWAVAVYRHQLADFRASLESQGPFVGGRAASTRILPARSRLALDVVNVGVSGAYRFGRRLAVGVGVSRYDFALDSRTERFSRAEPTGDLLTDGLTGKHFGPADFLPGNVANVQTQRGDDHDTALNLGIWWRPAERWSLGGVYRQGPDFGFAAVLTDGPAGEVPGRVDPLVGGAGVFHVPDVVGVGLAFRPTDSTLLALDWDRVRYSQMTDDLVNLLRAARGQRRFFHADDADEIHLGFELQVLGLPVPLSLRCGAWFDPDHRIRYTGDSELLRARFRAGDDQTHFAAGVGVVARRVQLDLAADVSQSVTTLSLSAVSRF